MKDVNGTLNQIEGLLCEAEEALINDDGRRWPPPPAPPKHRRDWATDNSDAVDPDDYDSCKAYVFANLPMRPVLPPGMLMRSFEDSIAMELFNQPDQSLVWGPYKTAKEATARCPLKAHEVEECHAKYGMRLEIKQSGRSISVQWSGILDPLPDFRPMSHAQRLAEDRLIRCGVLFPSAFQPVKRNASSLHWLRRDAEPKLGDVEQSFENQVAFRYMIQVVEPLARLAASRDRFNKLCVSLYRSPERRFLPRGQRLQVGSVVIVPYPWWSSHRIHWLALLDLVAGRAPRPTWIQRESVTVEIKRWAQFKAAWLRP